MLTYQEDEYSYFNSKIVVSKAFTLLWNNLPVKIPLENMIHRVVRANDQTPYLRVPTKDIRFLDQLISSFGTLIKIDSKANIYYQNIRRYNLLGIDVFPFEIIVIHITDYRSKHVYGAKMIEKPLEVNQCIDLLTPEDQKMINSIVGLKRVYLSAVFGKK